MKSTRISINLLNSLGMIILLLSFTGCASTNITNEDLTPLEKKLGEGWQCFLTPTSFDAPGTIFRINKDKVKHTAKDLKVQFKTGRHVIGKVTTKSEKNLTLLAAATLTKQLMATKLIDSDIKVSGNAKFSNKNETTISFDNTMKEGTEDDVRKTALRWLEENPPIEGNQYFLVREGFTATGIQMYLTKGIVDNLGGNARMGEIAEVNQNLTKDKNSGYQLKDNYDSPLRVCTKPERLSPKTAGLTGKKTYGFEPVNEPLDILKEGPPD